MKKITATAMAAVLIAAFASSAGASERHRRHVQPSASAGDARDAFAYYPGWGRPKVPSYGVYPGLIYGGATSAPAGR